MTGAFSVRVRHFSCVAASSGSDRSWWVVGRKTYAVASRLLTALRQLAALPNSLAALSSKPTAQISFFVLLFHTLAISDGSLRPWQFWACMHTMGRSRWGFDLSRVCYLSSLWWIRLFVVRCRERNVRMRLCATSSPLSNRLPLSAKLLRSRFFQTGGSN
jgi:hypothetical protein